MSHQVLGPAALASEFLATHTAGEDMLVPVVTFVQLQTGLTGVHLKRGKETLCFVCGQQNIFRLKESGMRASVAVYQAQMGKPAHLR